MDNNKKSVSIVKRDKVEVLKIIEESLKQEKVERIQWAERQSTIHEGDCFDMALRGSKVFLKAKGFMKKEL